MYTLKSELYDIKSTLRIMNGAVDDLTELEEKIRRCYCPLQEYRDLKALVEKNCIADLENEESNRINFSKNYKVVSQLVIDTKSVTSNFFKFRDETIQKLISDRATLEL